MKKSLALVIAILMCAPMGWGQGEWKRFGRQGDPQEPPAQAPQNEQDMEDAGEIPDVVSIPAGTHLPMTIVRAPQESQAHEGAKVYLRTRNAVRAEGGVVIPARSLVIGELRSNPSASPASSTLSIHLKTIVLPNDVRLPISGRVVGTIGGPKGPSPAAVGTNPMSALSGLTPEQIAMISGFALVGAEIGQAVGKGQNGAVVGSMIGGGVGLATILAMNGSQVHLRVGSNVDGVLEEPLALDPRTVR
jgi:hypothetical protein